MTKVKQIQQLEERYKRERTRALHFIEEAEKIRNAALQQMALTDAILGEIASKYGTIEIPKPEIGRYQVIVEKTDDGYIISAEKAKRLQ